MPRTGPKNAEPILLSPEDMDIIDLFIFRRSFNEDGSLRYVQAIGDADQIDAFALNQPVVFAPREKGKQKVISLPRLIMQRAMKRPLEAGELVIPANGKNGDNRRSNLVFTNRAELASGERRGTRSSAGEKYVYKNNHGRYFANFDNTYLGTYDEPDQAASAVDEYKRLVGEGMEKDEAVARVINRSRNSRRVIIQE